MSTTTPRTAWLAVGSIVAVALLSFGTLQTVALLAHEERTETTTVDGSGIATLDVATDGGRVQVIGTDREDIRIRARVSDGLVATDLSADVVGDRLEVRVRCNRLAAGPWCRASLVVEVPGSLEVLVRSDNDGIEVRGIDGRVDVRSENGSVTAEALAGPASLASSNGSVTATRLRAGSIRASSENGSVRIASEEPPDSVVATSENGEVEVALPDDGEAYAVEVATENGGSSNQVVTDPTSDRRVVARTENGDVTVRYLD